MSSYVVSDTIFFAVVMLPEKFIKESPVHESGKTRAIFCNEGKSVLSAGADGQMHLFRTSDLDANKFEPIKSEIAHHNGAITEIVLQVI